MQCLMNSESASRVITEADYKRLLRLLHQSLQRQPGEQFLLQSAYDKISHAQVARPEEVPGDVVTMNSCISLVDSDKGIARKVQLVYPRDAASDAGKVSVLSPLGTALLGRRVGEVIEYPDLENIPRFLIERLDFQPEAAGRFDL